MMELEANPDFYRGKPTIARIVLKFGPAMVTELLSGAVDVLSYVSPGDVLKLQGDPHFEKP